MIKAIVTTLKAGYKSEQDEVEQQGWCVGDEFEVIGISVGRSSSTVTLADNKTYNSVFFEFTEDGNPLNIYGDKRFFDSSMRMFFNIRE